MRQRGFGKRELAGRVRVAVECKQASCRKRGTRQGVIEILSRGIAIDFHGAISPAHDSIWYPGRVSAIAGTPGSSGNRFGAVTPSARSLPLRMCGVPVAMGVK